RIELVRAKRESGSQNLGFASRPFVLCGLPIKRPREGVLLHERRNGLFVLQVTGHPQYGLPWGQDRLVPIFLATLAIRGQSQTITFGSASEMLELPGSSLRFATLAQRRDSLWAMFSSIERRVANEETIPDRRRPCRATGTAMG